MKETKYVRQDWIVGRDGKAKFLISTVLYPKTIPRKPKYESAVFKIKEGTFYFQLDKDKIDWSKIVELKKSEKRDKIIEYHFMLAKKYKNEGDLIIPNY